MLKPLELKKSAKIFNSEKIWDELEVKTVSGDSFVNECQNVMTMIVELHYLGNMCNIRKMLYIDSLQFSFKSTGKEL